MHAKLLDKGDNYINTEEANSYKTSQVLAKKDKLYIKENWKIDAAGEKNSEIKTEKEMSSEEEYTADVGSGQRAEDAFGTKKKGKEDEKLEHIMTAIQDLEVTEEIKKWNEQTYHREELRKWKKNKLKQENKEIKEEMKQMKGIETMKQKN